MVYAAALMRRMLILLMLLGAGTAWAQEDVESDTEADGDADGDADTDADGDADADGEGDADAGAGGAESGSDSGSVIAPAEIGRRIEETFQELQALAPRLRRQGTTQEIERTIPNFVEHIDRLSRDPALDHLDTLHPGSLEDLEHAWDRVRDRLKEWQDELEIRTNGLTEAQRETLDAERSWRQTRQAHAQILPESQLERIDALLDRIGTVKRRVTRRLDEVLALQGELSDQGIRIARQASRIGAAQEQVRERRQRRDHRPLWKGWGRLGEVDAHASELVLREHVASVRAFVYTQKNSLFSHLAVLLALIAGFVFLRVRSTSRRDPSTPPSAHRAIRARPIASAVLLSWLVAPFIYDYVPIIVIAGTLIALVPALDLLDRHLLPTTRKPLLALMVLSALSVPTSLGFAPDWTSRWATLVLASAALFFTWPLWKAARTTPHARRLHRWLRLAALPLAYALFLLASGYVVRAELWTAGALWVLEQAVAIYLSVELLNALAELGLRQPAARVSYLVRNHRRKVVHYTKLALRTGGVIVLGFLALRSFDLLDPTVQHSRAAFEKTFVFGSIELSVGSILAFFVMLIGTFLVMRIVHVLLEHEILPRFRLEQGISSAISLSASYLLVAIGIVLAFGVAGVGPERLALLGGALGVGIGFGLQNVVSNFVSGLILVAERPIKVGDVIEVESLVGTVQRIGIRSSSVHSLDGAEVIVPNSDLVSGKLINWTLSDARRRFDLVIGAGYAHDPREVMKVLKQVVARQPLILHDPGPEVLCTSFADSAIEYTVRAWAGGYLEAIEAKSLLATRIHQAFAESGIEIPFPQQDVHVKSMPLSPSTAEAGASSGGSGPGPGQSSKA